MKRYLARFRLDDALGLASEPTPFHLDGHEVFWRGYIANAAELEADAEQRRERLGQPAEAGLFLFAYQRWGPDLPRHVVGEYSVVVHDKSRRTLLLAHDELGLTPLFYAELKDEFVVASHLEDLVLLSGIRDLDEKYIADYLAEGRHLGKHTPFKHIHRLLPGQSVVWKDGRLTEHKTWTLTGIEPLRYRDPREYEEQLRFLTAEAVNSSIQSTQKIWCELSGGLDSSTVLACAIRSGAKAEAFSIIYPQSRSADERKWISLVLEKYPVAWHTLDGDAARPFSELPFASAGEPNLFVVDAAARRSYNQMLKANDVGLVLTGQGGDATFLGDAPEPYYLADLFRRLRLPQFWTAVQSWKNASDQKRPSMYWLTRFGIQPCLKRSRGHFIDDEVTRVPWISHRFAEQHNVIKAARISNVPPQASIGDSWMMERILRNAHAVSAHFHESGTECDFRHPLLYRPLVAYMLSVPWQLKLHPQCDRLLQRRAFEEILPEPIVRRGNKLGPDQAYYSGLDASPEWCDRLTKNPQIVQRGYAELEPWRKAIQQAREGRTVGIRFLLSSASLEIWLQQLEGKFEVPA